MQDESKFQICVVPMGGGKTFVILTLIFILTFRIPGCKIFIYTSNQLLKQQLHDVLDGYAVGKDYEISDKMEVNEDYTKTHFNLVDESDAFVDTQAVSFNGAKLQGIRWLTKAERTFLITATATDFLKDVAKELAELEGEKYAYHEFASKAEYSGLGKLENQLHREWHATAKEKRDAMVRKMKSLQDIRPMILFTEGDAQALHDDVLTELEPGLWSRCILDIEGAMQARKEDTYIKKGLYTLALLLGRGLDCRLLKDAHVFIHAVQEKLSWTEVNQMLGRGCRTFGTPEGTYWSSSLHEKVDIKTQLMENEKKYHDGARHLRKLWDKWAAIPAGKRSLVQQFFTGNYWLCSKGQFRQNYTATFELLYDERPNKSSEDKQDDIKKKLQDAAALNEFTL
jgi:hypothetical protein